MILEVAILNVKKGLQHKFEKDFAFASRFISSVNGYGGHSLRKCLEHANRYILLVNWDSLMSHEEGFRKSKGYEKWKSLLHKYYEPFPVVEHYETIYENSEF